jgi:two-component system response regulator AtoC
MRTAAREKVRVLIVEDDRAQASALAQVLADRDREILLAEDGEEGFSLARGGVDLIVADHLLPRMTGVQMVRKLRDEGISTPALIVSGEATVSVAVEAMKAGALDFVQKPFDIDFFRVRVAQALEMRRTARELESLRRTLQQRGEPEIIGVSPAIAKVRHLVESAARTDIDVTLNGETGTGKEFVARTLHQCSRRSDKPFVVVDCASLPEPLLENELFGHEAGAYTGADRRASGLLSAADGGTVFIDEIGEMPLPLQSKLLRFLQTKEFRPVGATHPTKVGLRVVTATNRDLEDEVATGRFRQDLFYRINIFPIRLPPLRERAEDVPLLADHFLRAIAQEMDRAVEAFTPEALAALAAHDWPGNVRQLENLVRRMVVMAEGPRLGRTECRAVLDGASPTPEQAVEPFHQARAEALARFERAYLGELFKAAGYNVAAAARRAGLDRKNFWIKVKKYGLLRPSG